MPIVARFFGIAIKMFFIQTEHGVPHFHAVYGECNSVFSIKPVLMLEGDLPPRAQKMVMEWATQYQSELQSMWDNQLFKQLPGLE